MSKLGLGFPLSDEIDLSDTVAILYRDIEKVGRIRLDIEHQPFRTLRWENALIEAIDAIVEFGSYSQDRNDRPA